MITEWPTFPLSADESRAIYFRLAKLGARIFQPEGSPPQYTWEDEEVLAIAAEQSRFDYRLLYVLVAFVAEHLNEIHPFKLEKHLQRMRSPAVWGVIYEFSRKINTSDDLEDFFSILLRKVKAAASQFFYLSMRAPKPLKMLKIVSRTPSEFLRWGYLGEEVPILKELHPKRRIRTFSKRRRLQILANLFSEKGRITVADYLREINHSVSRQQAHHDLASYPKVKFISDRRGRCYSIPF